MRQDRRRQCLGKIHAAGYLRKLALVVHTRDMQTTRTLQAAGIALAALALAGSTGPAVSAPAVSTPVTLEAYAAPYVAGAGEYPISHEFAGLDDALDYCGWVIESMQFDCFVSAYLVYAADIEIEA